MVKPLKQITNINNHSIIKNRQLRKHKTICSVVSQYSILSRQLQTYEQSSKPLDILQNLQQLCLQTESIKQNENI